MTPAARAAAAIGVIDRIAGGTPPEKALTGWARGARYAGSADRRAVRDLVFDVLRRWRSTAAMGGGADGRARLLGLLRQEGHDPDEIFTGARHAPPPLSAAEREGRRMPEGTEALDLQDWQWPLFQEALGARAAEAAEFLRHRAPVFLRVNTLRVDPAEAIAALREEGIVADAHPLAPTALIVRAGQTRISTSRAYAGGLVELQDAASQAVIAALPEVGGPILDYCAGGGGKTLALAARYRRPVDAWDADSGRMKDLPARAARAGAEVRLLDLPPGKARHALVLCDVPCSGSGAWRRAPWGKWRLTPEGLDTLRKTQAGILRDASRLVAPGGCLAYATCSVLTGENEEVVEEFLATTKGYRLLFMQRFGFFDEADGFFLAVVRRD